MVVDNFEQIKQLFYFNEGNDMFFQVQIVRRAKDHKPDKIKERSIHSYFVRSREELEELKSEIIELCKLYGARAYINVAGKDFSELNKQLLLKLAEYNANGQIVNTLKIVFSVAGLLQSRTIRWVIDIDTHSAEYQNKVHKWLLDQGFKETDIITIPTLNGVHFITKKKFNTRVFGMVFPDSSIHKNSMGTLLYMEI